MSVIRWLMLPMLLLPAERVAACLSDADLELFGQIAYVRKMPSAWQIDGANPYRANNGYNDLAVKYSNRCQLIEDRLSFSVALYGLAYYPFQTTGAFEKDDNRMRVLFDRLSLSYNLSDTVRLDAGKIRNKGGLFYLKSPAGLLNNDYAGFKPTRINHPAMKQAYTESFWGAVLSEDSADRSLSLTVAPKFTHIDKRYESSSNWSALERSNSSDRYLLTYTDYRFDNFTPSASLMLGDSKSLALANSYNLSPQLIFNAELAWHMQQQWRHLDRDSAERVQNYAFPEELYRTNDKQGIELALGMQYTTDRFSQFGVEYYFQSEGYSAAQWRKQTDLIKFLNQRTHYAPLDNAFDAYKYLMASEIYNTSSKGNLLGRHYLNSYASILMQDQSSLKPWVVINMLDKSSIVGITYTKPLDKWSKQLEIYTGVYAAFGNKDSEFGLFGETLGNYLGFNYHF